MTETMINLLFFLLIASFAFVLFVIASSIYSRKMKEIEQMEITPVEIEDFYMMKNEFIKLLKNEEWIATEERVIGSLFPRTTIKVQDASMTLEDDFVIIQIGDYICRKKYGDIWFEDSRIKFQKELFRLINSHEYWKIFA